MTRSTFARVARSAGTFLLGLWTALMAVAFLAAFGFIVLILYVWGMK
jgi:nitrate reductase NapE component